jgi:hypothetical protein
VKFRFALVMAVAAACGFLLATTTMTAAASSSVSVSPRDNCGGFNGHVVWAGPSSPYLQLYGEVWDNSACPGSTSVWLSWDSPTHHNIQAQAVSQSQTQGVNYKTNTSATPGNVKVTVCSTHPAWHCGVPVSVSTAPPAPPTVTVTTTTPAPVVTVPVTVPVPEPAPQPRALRVKLTISWTWNRGVTQLRRVTVGALPGTSHLLVRCAGPRCPRPATATAAGRRAVHGLLRSLEGRRYRAGDRLLISLQAPGWRPERAEIAIRSGRVPKVRLLPVGASTAAAASAGHEKRGVASSRYLASNPRVLSGIGAAWGYDWSALPPARGGGPPWVPMVWGEGSVTPATTASLRALRRSGRAQQLLGFNEPDSSSQANMTPEQAAALWPRLERTGLKLGSPAPAVPSDGWLARFMAIATARHLRVDFIALHYYQDFTNPHAVSDLRGQLVAIHHRYRKPIWITEIGALDIRTWKEPMLHAPTDALAAGYMHDLFAMLDGLPFLQRYAWFTDDCWNDAACRYGSLFTSAGHVTRAGETLKTAP